MKGEYVKAKKRGGFIFFFCLYFEEEIAKGIRMTLIYFSHPMQFVVGVNFTGVIDKDVF
jgi:hypothetical protein